MTSAAKLSFYEREWRSLRDKFGGTTTVASVRPLGVLESESKRSERQAGTASSGVESLSDVSCVGSALPSADSPQGGAR
jgi:hypothetical protein